jgi:hypothetical protein
VITSELLNGPNNVEEKSMSTKEKGPRKMYQLFKLHKKHQAPNLPSGRPVISGYNSFTENMGFVRRLSC